MLPKISKKDTSIQRDLKREPTIIEQTSVKNEELDEFNLEFYLGDERDELNESNFHKRKRKQESTLVYFSIQETFSTKPNSRENSQFVIINQKAYLCGGLGRVKHCDIKALDLSNWN